MSKENTPIKITELSGSGRKALFDIKAPMEIPRYGCVYWDIIHDESWKKELD